MIKTADEVGVPLLEADFESVPSVPTTTLRKKNVVVQFARKLKRDCFLEETPAVWLKSSGVGCAWQAPFFVDEHLCPELERMPVQATVRQCGTGFKYVWFSPGTCTPLQK